MKSTHFGLRLNMAGIVPILLGLSLLQSAPFAPAQTTISEGKSASAAVVDSGVKQILAANPNLDAHQLTEISTDPLAKVDSANRIYYAEPRPSEELVSSFAPVTAEARDSDIALSQAFLLHSRPSSTRKIYLDFTGHTVTGTWWNGSYGDPLEFAAFSYDSDHSTFSDADKAVIIDAWSAIAEDYAPFDVDVTTEEPTEADLIRTNNSDLNYGTRALITDYNNPIADVCGCGGVAYLSVYGEVGLYPVASPAFNFAGEGFNGKLISDIVSHEVGHNLGLSHDGKGGDAYYLGAGSWAPIMGAGYYEPIAQWSIGDYSSSTNTEDDFSVITNNNLSLIADDHGNTTGTATAISTGTTEGLIGSRADKDVFSFSAGAGAYSLTVDSPSISPDLDVQLELLNEAGTVIATNNPTSATLSSSSASGMNASLSGTLENGNYYIRIDGVGVAGDTGYSDYGSVGQYIISASYEPYSAEPSAPSVPRSVTAIAGKTSATVSWLAPVNDGGESITGYTVTSTPGSKICTTTSELSCTVSNLTANTQYTFTVTATNILGTSSASTASTAVTAYDIPSAPTGLSAAAANGSITVSWNAASANGSPVTGYEVFASNGGGCSTSGSRSCVVSGLTNGTSYSFTVVATNAAGDSEVSASVTGTPATSPSTPVITSVVAGDHSITATWNAVATNGSAITQYKVTAGMFANCVTTELSCTITGLTNGSSYRITVRATNAMGSTDSAQSSVIVPFGIPTAPTTLKATFPAAGKMALVWSGALSNGLPITKYEYRYKLSTTNAWKSWVSTGTNAKATIAALVKNKTYNIQIRVTAGLTAISRTFTIKQTK